MAEQPAPLVSRAHCPGVVVPMRPSAPGGRTLKDRILDRRARAAVVPEPEPVPAPIVVRPQRPRKVCKSRAPHGAFGVALAELRTARGYTMKTLANRAGIHHSHISRLQSGERTPSREMVAALATALAASPAEMDRLLVAGGYVPGDPTSLALDRTVRRLGELLTDPKIPCETKTQLRAALDLLVSAAELHRMKEGET